MTSQHDHSRDPSDPPPLAHWLLRRTLPPESAASLLGDLREELARAFECGQAPFWQRGWYMWHVALFLLARLQDLPARMVVRRARPLQRPASGRLLTGLGMDLRLAVRSLARRPLYALTAVAVLAVAIGLNAAMFGFVNRLLIKPLPYARADQLVQLSQTAPDLGSMDVSFPAFYAWRASTRVFESMAAFDDTRFLLSGDGEPQRVEGAVVSASLLHVLGIAPVLGRFFTSAEEVPGANDVVVLSHALWQRLYGGDPAALGRALVLNGRARTIVGVGPRGFRFPEVADLWIPLALDVAAADPEDFTYDVVGRLRDDGTIAAAREEGERVVRELARAAGTARADLMGVDVYPLRRADVSAELGWASVLLLGAVGAVLLIACLNLAVLVAARGMARQAELSVRLALGASRWRLVAHLLAETALISLVGGGCGLLIGFWLTGLLNAVLPAERPFWMVLEVDSLVAGFVAVVTILTVVFVGLVPALQTTRSIALRVSRGLRLSFVRAQSALVLVQVAVSFALLLGAGLMLDGLSRMGRRDLGIDARGVSTVTYQVPPWIAAGAPALNAIHEQVLESVRALSGVRFAGAAHQLPVEGTGEEVVFEAAQRSDGGSGLPVARLYAVTPGFFDALGMRIVAGRDLDASSAGGVLVSEALATRYYGGAEAVGRRLRHGTPGARSPMLGADAAAPEIRGIVGDVAPVGRPDATPFVIYASYHAHAVDRPTLVVRAPGAEATAALVRERVREVAPAVLIQDARGLESVVAESLTLQRVLSGLLGAFAMAALVLAAIGMWGMMAYTVGLRRGEFAVRRALGAPPLGLVTMLLSRSARIVLPGLVIGAGLGWGLGRALQANVPGIGAPTAITQLATAAVFAAVALTAVVVPSLGALRIGAAEALRGE